MEAAAAHHRSKPRDGQTDLYGLLFKPTISIPIRKYPLINHIIPARKPGALAAATFRPRAAIARHLPRLGFVVVEIDGMGTPWRFPRNSTKPTTAHG